MALNYIWLTFFVVAFLVALFKTIFFGDFEIWTQVVNATFTSAKQAFEISLGLTGVLALWMGLMRVGEKGGIITMFGKLISPLFCRLFPGVPKDHPAMGSIFMNVSANMLGLDNAATPLGLKAMKDLQELNPKKDTATDAMLMFLILNASGLTLIPISVIMYRTMVGQPAANPTDVFLPILLSTTIATLFGLIILCIKQRIRFDRVLLSWLLGLIALVGGMMFFLSSLPHDVMNTYSTFFADSLLFTVIITFLGVGALKRINVYDAFIEGAKDGFHTAVMIIPYLSAILVAIAVFRASGAMDYLTNIVATSLNTIGLDSEWVGALPTALMKPLSGSGSRGLMVDVMNTYGADSFVGRVACCVQGATDTTFYIIAVYFGSVGIKKTRYAVPYALATDVVACTSAILMAYLFFSE